MRIAARAKDLGEVDEDLGMRRDVVAPGHRSRGVPRLVESFVDGP